MKLFSQTLEVQVIKRICTSRKDTTLLASIDKNYFYTEPAKQAFERIKFLAKEKAEIISWDSLITDPALPESTRELLINCEIEDNNSSVRDLIKNLTNYKKARTLLKISEEIQEKLTQEKVEVDKLFVNTAEQLAEVKSGQDISSCFTRIGDNSNTNACLKQLLKGGILRFYPTGFKQWDNENGGLPKGKLGIIAATSGAGKSLCAEQLCINMALQGVRVCLVPLEMNAVDMLQRFIANRTSTDMSQLNKLTPDDKNIAKQTYAEFKAFERLLAQSATSIDLFNPPEDIEMSDLLMLLKPFEYDVIIIDYIGLLKGFDDDNQWRKMGAAARYAKIWGETNNVSVLCLAQLSEDMVIRYSRAMKEHADFMWTWNAGKLNDLEGSTTIIKVEPQKGRNQAQKNFYLKVDYKKMSMVDATEEEIQAYEDKNKNSEDFSSKKKPQKTKKSEKENVGVKAGTVDEDLYSDL